MQARVREYVLIDTTDRNVKHQVLITVEMSNDFTSIRLLRSHALPYLHAIGCPICINKR